MGRIRSHLGKLVAIPIFLLFDDEISVLSSHVKLIGIGRLLIQDERFELSPTIENAVVQIPAESESHCVRSTVLRASVTSRVVLFC